MLTRDEKKARFTGNELLWAGAITVAAVSGVFVAVVSTLLIANYIQIQATTPTDNPQVLQLRKQLLEATDSDPNLIRQIEALDLLARKAFFTSRAHVRTGAWLLLAGAAVFVTALRIAARARARTPLPDQPAADESARSRRYAQYAVLATAAVLVVLGLAAAFSTRLDIPSPAADAKDASVAYPDWDAMQLQWPSFRGPGGYGVAHFATAPTEWDAASGKGVKWKLEVPLPGMNSPVVWDKKVFVSGATADAREVYCYDADSGQLLWRQALPKLPGTPDKPPKVGEETGFAAPTMVAHGDRVCALFANGDLACLDFNGAIKWSVSLGMPDNHYGHSSSLLAFQNLVYVQYDQRANSKLLALDLNTGRAMWTAKREKISWSSPVCAKTAFGFQLVLNSEKAVDAYEPATGKLLWRLDCLDGEVAPSPAFGGGMFFVANDNATATAIKLSGDAAAPKAEAAWQWDENLPDVSSPVGSDTHFFVATSRGYIICLDNKTGTVAWGQEYENGFYSSPILAGNRLYATDKEGKTYVIAAAPTYQLIATSTIGEPVNATPAVVDGRFYIRGDKHLFCMAN